MGVSVALSTQVSAMLQCEKRHRQGKIKYKAAGHRVMWSPATNICVLFD
jgi:hypothetical protein